MLEPSVIRPLVLYGYMGAPREWIEKNQPFEMDPIACEETFSQFRVTYFGDDNDTFKAVRMTHRGSLWHDGTTLWERYKIVIFRIANDSSDCEKSKVLNKVNKVITILVPKDIDSCGIKFVPYEFCTEEEKRELNNIYRST